MAQLKKITGVALASAFAGLVAFAPITVQAGAEGAAEVVQNDRAPVFESSAIPFEFAHNLGGSPGELY